MKIDKYHKRNAHKHFKDYWSRERETIIDQEDVQIGDYIAHSPRPTWDQFFAMFALLNTAPRAISDNIFSEILAPIKNENKV